jgi:hypothetical protein
LLNEIKLHHMLDGLVLGLLLLGTCGASQIVQVLALAYRGDSVVVVLRY